MYPFAILFNINANRSFGIKNHRHIPFRMRNTDKKGIISQKRFAFRRITYLLIFFQHKVQ